MTLSRTSAPIEDPELAEQIDLQVGHLHHLNPETTQ